jgi:NAD(P)-dependent dehydrogenase (short-subunit alcohol dehydrogenase family)
VLLDDTVAMVTGAGAGIGREIAIRLAEEGADVVLAGRSVEAMQEVARRVAALGREAFVVPLDLRNGGSVDGAVGTALERFGRVDVLVNNSGVGGPTKQLVDLSAQEWDETFSVNVTGTFLCCRAVLPQMIERRRGSIVVIGSITGKRPLVNRAPYAASKAALIGLVRTLAAEVGPHGVRVNLVSPGGVEGQRLDWVIESQAEARGLTPTQVREEFAGGSALRRLVSPVDVADVTAYLASPRARSVTGEDVNVAAGLVMY